jgi:hypothetical protein
VNRERETSSTTHRILHKKHSRQETPDKHRSIVNLPDDTMATPYRNPQPQTPHPLASRPLISIPPCPEAQVSKLIKGSSSGGEAWEGHFGASGPRWIPVHKRCNHNDLCVTLGGIWSMLDSCTQTRIARCMGAYRLWRGHIRTREPCTYGQYVQRVGDMTWGDVGGSRSAGGWH